jgi:hypothetical protein
MNFSENPAGLRGRLGVDEAGQLKLKWVESDFL